jgi:hypothetical protein
MGRMSCSSAIPIHFSLPYLKKERKEGTRVCHGCSSLAHARHHTSLSLKRSDVGPAERTTCAFWPIIVFHMFHRRQCGQQITAMACRYPLREIRVFKLVLFMLVSRCGTKYTRSLCMLRRSARAAKS